MLGFKRITTRKSEKKQDFKLKESVYSTNKMNIYVSYSYSLKEMLNVKRVYYSKLDLETNVGKSLRSFFLKKKLWEIILDCLI